MGIVPLALTARYPVAATLIVPSTLAWDSDPDLVGQGHGKTYAEAVATFGAHCYQTSQLQVTIAAFNRRAQRVWQQLGFETVETFQKINSHQTFIVMIATV